MKSYYTLSTIIVFIYLSMTAANELEALFHKHNIAVERIGEVSFEAIQMSYTNGYLTVSEMTDLPLHNDTLNKLSISPSTYEFFFLQSILSNPLEKEFKEITQQGPIQLPDVSQNASITLYTLALADTVVHRHLLGLFGFNEQANQLMSTINVIDTRLREEFTNRGPQKAKNEFKAAFVVLKSWYSQVIHQLANNKSHLLFSDRRELYGEQMLNELPTLKLTRLFPSTAVIDHMRSRVSYARQGTIYMDASITHSRISQPLYGTVHRGAFMGPLFHQVQLPHFHSINNGQIVPVDYHTCKLDIDNIYTCPSNKLCRIVGDGEPCPLQSFYVDDAFVGVRRLNNTVAIATKIKEILLVDEQQTIQTVLLPSQYFSIEIKRGFYAITGSHTIIGQSGSELGEDLVRFTPNYWMPSTLSYETAQMQSSTDLVIKIIGEEMLISTRAPVPSTPSTSPSPSHWKYWIEISLTGMIMMLGVFLSFNYYCHRRGRHY